MSVASRANTSILLRMLSSRSARSSRETACSHEGTRCSLEVRLVRRGTVHGGDRGVVEAQVHGELAAMMHEVIEHGAAVYGELRVRGPGLLKLRIRGRGEGGPRRGGVAVEQLEDPGRAVEGFELERRPPPRRDIELGPRARVRPPPRQPRAPRPR